ncbi:MAG: hypothetical protein JWN04_3805 [Myxococcaceae bacterium]|nr:hypothetical protein [Myxococcaceae bacterium]
MTGCGPLGLFFSKEAPRPYHLAHQMETASQARRWQTVWLAALLLGARLASGCETSTSQTTQPVTAASDVAPFEPIRVRTVPLSDDLTLAVAPSYAPDGRHLVFTSATEYGGAPADISIVEDDGSDYTCLTCELPAHPSWNLNAMTADRAGYDVGLIARGYPFSDGQRVLIAFERGPAVTELSAWVLECAPDLAHCTQAALLPVQQDFGDGGASGGVLARRSLRIAPDGTHLAWTALRKSDTLVLVSRLTRVAGGSELSRLRSLGVATLVASTFPAYVATDARVIDSALLESTKSTAAVRAGPPFQLEAFAGRGASVLVTRLSSMLAPDTYQIDLQTGDSTRLTDYPDWNQGAGLSPDGSALIQWSARTMGRLQTFSQIPRPALGGAFASSLAARYLTGTAQSLACNLQAWLLPASGDSPGNGMKARAGAPARLGQPVDPVSSDNASYALGLNTSGDLQWSADSTKIALFEQGSDFGMGTPPSTSSRLVVAQLSRAPSIAPVIVPSEVGAWAAVPAPPAQDAPPVSDLTISGQVRGTATLSLSGAWPASGSTSVRYQGYSDDGAVVLDGSETLDHTTETATYSADLTVSGAHSGSLRASGPFFALPPAQSGSVESSFDGQQRAGYPSFGSCPTLLPAVTPLIVVSKLAGKSELEATLDVMVSADVRGDRRPVRGALVSVPRAGVTGTTDVTGHASLVVPRAVMLMVTASAGSTFSSAAVSVSAL